MPERLTIEIKDDGASEQPPSSGRAPGEFAAEAVAARAAASRANAAANASGLPEQFDAGRLRAVPQRAGNATPNLPPMVPGTTPPPATADERARAIAGATTPVAEDPVARRMAELGREKWREGLAEQGKRRAQEQKAAEAADRAAKLQQVAGGLGKGAQLAGMAGQGGAAAAMGAGSAALTGFAAGGPVGAAVAAAPMALQYLQQQQEERKQKEIEAVRQATESVTRFGQSLTKLAGNDSAGGLMQATAAASQFAERMGLIDEKQREQIAFGLETLQQSRSLANAFIARGEQLAQFSPELVGAQVYKQRTEFELDAKEADELGPAIARLTEAQVDADRELRELLLPIKRFVIESLATMLSGIAKSLDNISTWAELIGGNIQANIQAAVNNIPAFALLEKLFPDMAANLKLIAFGRGEKDRKTTFDETLKVIADGLENLANRNTNGSAQVVGVAAGGILNVPILRNR